MAKRTKGGRSMAKRMKGWRSIGVPPVQSMLENRLARIACKEDKPFPVIYAHESKKMVGIVLEL